MKSIAAALVVCGLMAAAPAHAQGTEQKTAPATKVFRYLDKFLAVSPDKRSKIRVLFYLKKDGRPASGYHPVLIDGDTRTPLPLAADGRFERLPTLEQMLRKPTLAIDAPTEARFNAEVQIQSTVKLAQEIDAREVVASIRQVNGVLRDTVGALAILAPSIRASFPGAGSGVAINASGVQTKLPNGPDGSPIYDPNVQRNAVTLRFANPPKRVDLTPKS